MQLVEEFLRVLVHNLKSTMPTPGVSAMGHACTNCVLQTTLIDSNKVRRPPDAQEARQPSLNVSV